MEMANQHDVDGRIHPDNFQFENPNGCSLLQYKSYPNCITISHALSISKINIIGQIYLYIYMQINSNA